MFYYNIAYILSEGSLTLYGPHINVYAFSFAEVGYRAHLGISSSLLLMSLK